MMSARSHSHAVPSAAFGAAHTHCSLHHDPPPIPPVFTNLLPRTPAAPTPGTGTCHRCPPATRQPTLLTICSPHPSPSIPRTRLPTPAAPAPGTGTCHRRPPATPPQFLAPGPPHLQLRRQAHVRATAVLQQHVKPHHSRSDPHTPAPQFLAPGPPHLQLRRQAQVRATAVLQQHVKPHRG
eukprot:366085-Chlamydomonas_euryale.AAC.3